MSDAADPRCPECGEPIGATATYCMHCSADLEAERAAADADGDGRWDGSSGPTPEGGIDEVTGSGDGVLSALGVDLSAVGGDGPVLADDGPADDVLTVLVGIAGGLVVGLVGTVVLLVVTGSGWALGLGVLAWLGATVYLVRRRTVQTAVSKTGYAVAVVLLLVPLVALSPVADVEGGRGELFAVLLVFAAVPAAVAAVVGWIAGRFVPGDR